MYAYSSSCQLRHFQLRHCIVNDVISTGVVWCCLVMESDSYMDILAIYCYWKSNWKSAHWMYVNYLTRVDARRSASMRVNTRRHGGCEWLLYLTLVWFDVSKRVHARWRARCERGLRLVQKFMSLSFLGRQADSGACIREPWPLASNFRWKFPNFRLKTQKTSNGVV